MSLSIHRRTGHGRALLSVVCAERNESEFRANREKQETTTSFCGLNGLNGRLAFQFSPASFRF